MLHEQVLPDAVAYPGHVHQPRFYLEPATAEEYLVVDANARTREIAPGVTDIELVDAQRICQDTLLSAYDEKSEKPKTLLETFNYIADKIYAYDPDAMQDLITVVTLAESSKRITILENVKRGLVLGPKVMNRFAVPLQQAISDTIHDDNRSTFMSFSEDFKQHLDESFCALYLKVLSTFAGILETPNGALHTKITIGDKRQKTVGYTHKTLDENYQEAMYALKITNYALLRAMTAITPKESKVVNKFGSGSYDITFENSGAHGSHATECVVMHVRTETEYNKGPYEYGYRNKAEASVAINVPMGDHDRRGAIRRKPTYDPKNLYKKMKKNF